MRALLLLVAVAVSLLATPTASRPQKFFLHKDGVSTNHHIIPGNILLEFYQTALRQRTHHRDIEIALKDTLRHIAQTSSYNGVEVRELQKIRNGNINFNRYTLSLFYWMQGNLFLGPRPEHRVDDPGSGFEYNAQYIVPHHAYRTLHDIYTGMNLYIRNRRPQDFLYVADKIQRLNRRAPYAFDQSQWSGNCRSQCAIRTSHSQPTNPRPTASGHTHGHGHRHPQRGRRPHWP